MRFGLEAFGGIPKRRLTSVAIGDESHPMWLKFAFGAVLFVAYLRVVLPSLVDLTLRGRSTFEVSDSGGDVSSASQAVGSAITVILIVLCMAIVLTSLRMVSRRPAAPLVVVLLPVTAFAMSSLINAQDVGSSYIVYVLFAAACWLTSPPGRCLKVVGVCGVAIAILSVAMGILTPGLALQSENSSSKAIVGTGLLAGPFLQSNVLSIVVALSMPFIFLFKRRFSLAVGLAVCCVCLLWSGSRTAMFAVAVMLAFTYVAHNRQDLRRIASVMGVIGGLVMVLIPLLVSDPNAYTARGRIWLNSLSAWLNHPVFGLGADWYAEQRLVRSELGAWASHGHNGFVNTLTTGGAVALICLVALALYAFRHIDKDGSVASELSYAGFLVTVLLLMWFEGSLRMPNADSAFFWMPLLLGVLAIRGPTARRLT